MKVNRATAILLGFALTGCGASLVDRYHSICDQVLRTGRLVNAWELEDEQLGEFDKFYRPMFDACFLEEP